ncbi:MAG: C10 family peptidase [Prevotellaceae bacterium]|nr:C10 family peptidase [Candidatus Faecinaster equi]
MKKIIILFALCTLAKLLWAAPVDPTTAQQIAESFLNAPQKDSLGVVKAPTRRKMVKKLAMPVTSNQHYYIFNATDGEGFVIVSADDVAVPILGHSLNGHLDTNNLPDGFKWLLSCFNNQIEIAINNGETQNDITKKEWDNIRKKVSLGTPIINALVKTQWDQAPYYNEKCPFNYLVFQNTVTGCAATALAQVMKYWEWPKIGDGFHSYNTGFYGKQSANFGATTYDWSHMPNQLTSSSTQQQINAVSTLMYHCGVAMDMNYGLSGKWIFYDGTGSSATTDKIETAVKNYFRYDQNTSTICKDNYSEANWISILKSQLDLGHPMVYCGKGPGEKDPGHAFVCDGYDSQNYFHFNWGWSGSYDGWYPITALIPGPNGIGSGSSGNYTAKQWAVINMVPRATSANAANLQAESNWTLSSDSIRYGGTLSGNIKVKNYGNGSFTGDLIAVLLDENGNYFTEVVLKSNCTIAKNSTLTLNPSVSANAGLIPGRYYASLFYKSADLGYQIVGSEYYPNVTTFKVYHSAPIETFSSFKIYSESNDDLITGHNAQINLTMKNVGTSSFVGKVALVLYNADLTNGQDFDEINLNLVGIGSGETRTLTFSGKISVTPGTYILGFMYADKNGNINFGGSTYFPNPIYVIVKSGQDTIAELEDSLKPGKYAIVASRNKETDNTWYYMTATKDGTKDRFVAVNTNKTDVNAVNITNLDAEYIWTLEANGTSWKLKNGSQYIGWSSNNTAKLDATGRNLTMDVVANQVQTHFYDGTAERYLSLNATTGNNYFAFYGNKNQITYLSLLPIEEDTPEPPITTNEYYIVAKRSTGNYYFFTPNKVSGKDRLIAVDAGTSVRSQIDTVNTTDAYLWTLEDSGTGKLLKSHNGEYLTCTAAKSAIMSPTGIVLNLTNNNDGTVTFSYAADASTTHYLSLANAGYDYFVFYANANQVTHLLLMPKGKGTTPTNYEELNIESSTTYNVHKIMHNGIFYILRDGNLFTATGARVK